MNLTRVRKNALPRPRHLSMVPDHPPNATPLEETHGKRTCKEASKERTPPEEPRLARYRMILGSLRTLALAN